MRYKEKKPYGYVYKATNQVNGKVYIGQTGTSRWRDDQNPVKGRWKEEVQAAYSKYRTAQNMRYVEQAIVKYGGDNFEVKIQDIAKNLEELDQKERDWIAKYDSTNREKGYNLTEGGLGGTFNEVAKGNVSKAITEKWRKKEHAEKQIKERRRRARNPEWVNKMTEINQERSLKKEYRKKLSKAGLKKWQEKEYREKVSNKISSKWQEKNYREKQLKAKREGGKSILDIKQFLEDIKEMNTKKELIKKYGMDGKTINRKIKRMLGYEKVNNYTDAKKYLEDKNLNIIMKNVDKTRHMGRDDPKFKEKMTRINRDRAKDIEWLRKMNEINQTYAKKINNVNQFLRNIKELNSKKDLNGQYGMSGKTINRKIEKILGKYGIKNYSQAREYLKYRKVGDVMEQLDKDKKKLQDKI